jgi:hypothetical protein
MRLIFMHLLLRVSAAQIICGMGVFSFRQPTVAACWSGRCIPLLGELLVQVTASAQAAGRLLACWPDVAKLLAVKSLRKIITDYSKLNSSLITLHGWNRKHRFQQYPYCCVFADPLFRKGFFYCCLQVHFRGNLFTEPLSSSELFRLSDVMLPLPILTSQGRGDYPV